MLWAKSHHSVFQSPIRRNRIGKSHSEDIEQKPLS